MSSKIDGVPRELLERLQSQTELSNDWDEVQALLAAPAVERQPAAEVTRYDRWYQGSWFEVATWDVEKFEQDGWKIRRLYTAPPELAELQATIERLQATCDGLDSQNDALASAELATAGETDAESRTAWIAVVLQKYPEASIRVANQLGVANTPNGMVIGNWMPGAWSVK